jgi:hypothetical protein
MVRLNLLLLFLHRGAHMSITGRPFSRPIQDALTAFVASHPKLTSQFWITLRLADSLGIGVLPDEQPCPLPSEAGGGQAAPDSSLALYNACQTTQPALFGHSMCRQQRIPVSHHNKVVMGEAFGALRAAMMTHGIYSPYWIPKDMAVCCLGLSLLPTAVPVAVGPLELVSAEHTSDSDLVRKVVVSMYAPCMLTTGAEISHAPAVFTLKAAQARRRLRSEFWARREELAPRLLQLAASTVVEPVSVALADGEAPALLYNLDDTVPLERGLPQLQPAPSAPSAVQPLPPAPQFDETNIEPPDDIESIPMHVTPSLPPATVVRETPGQPSSPRYAPSTASPPAQPSFLRHASSTAPPPAQPPRRRPGHRSPPAHRVIGREEQQQQQRVSSTSLLRPPAATTRDVVLSVEHRSIDDGTVDFVRDEGTSHVFLVLRGGEVRIDLTSLGVHVGP